jgi:hypothetical protein
VRAELRGLDSAEAPDGPASFRPDDPEVFALAIGASIGAAGEQGADIFYFHVCSPRWIETNPPPKGFEFMHGYLVLPRWDSGIVERAIGDLCLHTEGADWQEVATKLSRHGSWEFEDYREAT